MGRGAPIRTIIAGTCLGAALAAPAQAQNIADAGDVIAREIPEVVVTAQRREENLQDVPISIAAFDESQLQTVGITNSTDLGTVTPGLMTPEQYGYFQPHLRGVGTTAPSASVENPVATYVDGVYDGIQTGSVFAMAGIDRVEVLKGPQGTLFGRNATGGLIQIVTKNPEQDFGGTASVTAGDYSTYGTSLYVTDGLTSKLAANLSVYFQDQVEGFGKNLFTGEAVNKTEDFAVRQKMLYRPSDDDSILIAVDYERNDSAPVIVPAPGTTPLGGPPYTGPRQDADGYFQPFNLSRQGGASVKVDHAFGFAQLESTTAYLQSSLDTSFDGTLVRNFDFALNIELIEKHKQFTQEFDLRSPTGSRITWTAGLYYYYADARYAPVILLGGLLDPLTSYLTYSKAIAWSGAAFAQGTTAVFDATNLTLGLRYTIERKRFSESQHGGLADGSLQLFDYAFDQHQNSQKPTWRISLDRKLAPDALVYGSYNRGYKSGGFDDQELPVRTYAPEVLDAYEVGSKTDFAGHELEFDAAGFFYNYRNIQTVAYPAGTEIIYSAPGAHIYGADLDFKAAPFAGFSIVGGIEFLHATYLDFPGAQLSIPDPAGGSILSSFDAAGRRMPLAPAWTVDVAPLYVAHLGAAGELSLGAVFSYNDGFYYEPDNRLHQGPYFVINASATWEQTRAGYGVRLWAKNLTDKSYTVGMYAQANGDYAAYAPPRTYGVTVTKRF